MRLIILHNLRVVKNELIPNFITKILKFFKIKPKLKLGILSQHKPRKIDLSRFNTKNIETKGFSPSISIVTPSFNQGKYVLETIASILGQNYSNLTYRVQDGGSSDETLAILKNIESDKFSYESMTDKGQANAINLGFAKGGCSEIMGWINSDDVLLPGALATVANYFYQNPDIDIVYGNRLIINEENKLIGRWVMPKHDDEILSWVDYIPQETLFWRRRAWESIGSQLDESFKFALDWDLILRFRSAGMRFARIPKFLGMFRVHGLQKTSTQISSTGADEMKRILFRTHGRVPSQLEIDDHIRSYLHRNRFVDSMWSIRHLSFLK